MSTPMTEQVGYGKSKEGYFVLENASGETVRSLKIESSSLFVVYRHDTRRVEALSSTAELDKNSISYDVLSDTTAAKLKKAPVEIGKRGRVRWVSSIPSFAPAHDLQAETTLEPKAAFGWSVGIQAGLAVCVLVAGFFAGTADHKAPLSEVTLLTQDQVAKILSVEKKPEAKVEEPRAVAPQVAAPQLRRARVVAPTAHKVVTATPSLVAPRSNHVKKSQTTVAHKGTVRGGGFVGEGRRGYGTNEEHMNEIGALAALNAPRVKGGNGGRGGLNLQAVGTESGSGAGGSGHGGFGSNGGGGHGLGGLGTGRGSGLSNAMYGKGLVAAPFGDGSPAPGSGGYGTRGKAGGGAQGAGYGTQTVVGSWKGTGPKGNGPAGSGSGSGDPYGSPYGAGDGDDDEIATGGLSMDQIRQIIERNIGQVRYCYEQALQKEPRLSGRVAVRFQIGKAGSVTFASVKHSSVHSAQVENCIVGKLRSWAFPKPQGGVTVGVVYPFVLNRTVSMR